ncbi:MAG TPA: TonB-dependent receptor plug domain-containing protein [Gemmatimonadaceae bacterium]
MRHTTRLLAVVATAAFLQALTARTAHSQGRADSTRVDSSTIATGPLARAPLRAAGVSVGVIDSAEIAASTAPTFSELLQARLPGLRVLRSGGRASDGSLVMLRGPVSFFNSTAPILIVDGARVDARQADTVPFLGETVGPSRLDDLFPEDIQRIEILSGPAAALYGAGAAAGVIVVTTKSGGNGPLIFDGRVQYLSDVAPDKFPANYRRVGTSPITGQPTDCSLLAVAAGSCAPTGLDVFNPLEQESPFRTGRSGLAHLSVGGKALGTNMYVGATGLHRQGVLPHDDDGRLGLRAKVTRALPGRLVVQGTGGYVRDNARMGIDGPLDLASDVITQGLLGAAESTINRGYHEPAIIDSLYPSHLMSHWTGGLSVRLEPLSWLESAALVARDRVTQNWRGDDFGPLGGHTSPNLRATDESDITTRSARMVAHYQLGAVHAATAITFDNARQSASISDSAGTPLTFANSSFENSSWTTYSLAQNLALPEAFVINGSVERLASSLFGTNIGNDLFPSINAAWSPPAALYGARDLRLHAGYAELPGALPNLATLDELPTQIIGTTSSPVKTERTRSIELGFDATFEDFPRVSVNAFRSTSTRLLDALGLPPFGGPVPVASGVMQNQGIEVLAQVLLIRFFEWQWTATVSFAALQNRVTHLDGAPQFRGYGITRQGSPVGAVRVTPYTFADANHNGIIELDEVQLGAFDAKPSLPTVESGIHTEMKFSYGLSATAVVDYRRGNTVVNTAGIYRCQRGNCQAVQDPSAPLNEQAAAVAAIKSNGEAVVGFASDGSFVKLRELALHWRLPIEWARYIGGKAEMTLAGRNLATSTKYTGIDPEISSVAPDVLPREEFARTPISRTFLLRFDVGMP